MAKIGFLRTCLLTGSLVAATTPVAVSAYEPAMEPGERVAMALADGQAAREDADDKSLARALGVIERAGAHPLEGWAGADPVPEWRGHVPAAGSPLRGSPLGPGYRLGLVPAGQSESFEQVFLSGRKASISVASHDEQPISLRVLDGDRRVVCQSGLGLRACNWVPLFTQRYRIEVHNDGRQKARYYLVVD